MKERDLIAFAKRYAHERGAAAVKYHGSQFSEAGVPDLLICLRGRFIAAEAKLPGGKLTEQQSLQLDRFKIAGAKTFVFTSKEEFERKLDDILDDR